MRDGGLRESVTARYDDRQPAEVLTHRPRRTPRMPQIRSILPAHQERTADRTGGQPGGTPSYPNTALTVNAIRRYLSRAVGPVCTGCRVAVRTGQTLSGRAVGDAAGRTEVGPGGGPRRGLQAGEEQPHRLL